jgi:hypothetical protein
MAKFNLIITADYEVFGNGSGDVLNCMVNPTNNLLEICNSVEAKLTIFMDVCELWAFEEVEKGGFWDLDYSPSGEIKSQLIDAVENGHDVQLHFHPQWLDYKYLGKGKWELNHEKWRLPSCDKQEIDLLFRRGKQTLEELLQPIKEDYVCNVFRAGGWCIQPEEIILKAMKKHGFKIESSVAVGVSSHHENQFFDFTSAPDLPQWKIDNKVTSQDDGALLEIPIFTSEMDGITRSQFLAKRLKRNIPQKPEGCVGFAESSTRKSKFSKVVDLLKKQRSMFNFSDATTVEEMIWFIEKAREKYRLEETIVPLVMIGHPKTFANEKELKEFLFWAANQVDISFTDYNSYLNEYQSFS